MGFSKLKKNHVETGPIDTDDTAFSIRGLEW